MNASSIKEDALIKLKSILMVKEREFDGVFEELDGIVDIDTINKSRESRGRHLSIWKYILESVEKRQI